MHRSREALDRTSRCLHSQSAAWQKLNVVLLYHWLTCLPGCTVLWQAICSHHQGVSYYGKLSAVSKRMYYLMKAILSLHQDASSRKKLTAFFTRVYHLVKSYQQSPAQCIILQQAINYLHYVVSSHKELLQFSSRAYHL